MAVLLTAGLAVLPSVTLAEQLLAAVSPSGNSSILAVEMTGDAAAIDRPIDLDLNFGAIVSPSGMALPGIYARLDEGDIASPTAYVAPKRDGLRIRWTEDFRPSSDGGRHSRGKFKLPKSFGVSFTHHLRGLELSLGSDYGKTPRPVPGGLRLVEDRKLLRYGVHVGAGGFRMGGSFGSDVDPGELGETLTWTAVASYGRDPVSVGLVYSYTMETESPTQAQADILGSLQAGIGYAITPDARLSLNLAHRDFLDRDGHQINDLAGILGFSLHF